MKKFTNIQSAAKELVVLSPSQMLDVKGGALVLDLLTGLYYDDKRRDRPGGGISTL